MRAVVQRVAGAQVTVEGRVIAEIGSGLLVLLGIARRDTPDDASWLLKKLLDLRIFENDLGKFDRSLRDSGGALMVVSQFTLYADTGKGRRPSFTDAAPPEMALPLYEYFVTQARAEGVHVGTGEFGAHMHVRLTNDGPVTVILDSADR